MPGSPVDESGSAGRGSAPGWERGSINAARIRADRWELWCKVIDHRLVPPPDELDGLVAARRAEAERLWTGLLSPGMAAGFAAELAAPVTARLRGELGRMASAAHQLASGLYALHANAPTGAEATARAAIWLTLASAVVDQKVDDGELSPDEVRRVLNPTAFLAALAPGAAPLAMPGQPFLELLLRHTTTAIGDRIAAGRTAFDRAVTVELERCLREMIAGQLDSPRLKIHPLAELAEVEATLHRVNALTVWIPAFLGLLGEPEPPAATVRAVRQITTRVGEIGWALDALSDIHGDLEAGVWSLVWLELARRTGPGAIWLREFPDRPERALDALAASDVIPQLLTRIGLALDEIARMPDVSTAAVTTLVAFCRYMIWSFLIAPPPP
jgi:hypothetical protein